MVSSFVNTQSEINSEIREIEGFRDFYGMLALSKDHGSRAILNYDYCLQERAIWADYLARTPRVSLVKSYRVSMVKGRRVLSFVR